VAQRGFVGVEATVVGTPRVNASRPRHATPASPQGQCIGALAVHDGTGHASQHRYRTDV